MISGCTVVGVSGAAATGVSTATIVRINQWLRHGTGGYQHMLDKMHLNQET